MPTLLSRLGLFFCLISCMPGPVSATPERHFIEGVPYTQQLPNFCGPAALSSLLAFWGIHSGQKDIAKGICDGSRSGTNAGDLVIYCRESGLSAYSFNGTIDELKMYITQGYPVLVLQQWTKSDASGHYRVVVGYDDTDGVIVLRDSNGSALVRIPYADFKYLWDKQADWGMIAMPREKDNFRESLDKSNSVVHMDLALAYIRRKDFKHAKEESLQAITIEPDNPYAKDILQKSQGKTVSPQSLAPIQNEAK